MNGEATTGETASRESRFPAISASIAAARHWARDCLTGFGAPVRLSLIAQTTELLVSELVTNAIRHGSGPPLLRLTWDGRLLCISVSDLRDRWPQPPAVQNTEPGGFGIQMVERLAQRWGVIARAPGKTVWAELAPGT